MHSVELSTLKEVRTMHASSHFMEVYMAKDTETSGQARARMLINKKPINPRTFEKLIQKTGTKPVDVIPTTGTRLFLKRDIDVIIKRLPKSIKRGQRLILKKR